jgi:hypothetical protein
MHISGVTFPRLHLSITVTTQTVILINNATKTSESHKDEYATETCYMPAWPAELSHTHDCEANTIRIGLNESLRNHKTI